TVDGNKVAFLSAASDLVAGDANGLTDVFLRAVASGPTTRVSVDATNGDPNGASAAVTIDRDGRFVAYATAATDVIATDTNGADDIYLRDLGGPARLTIGDVTVPEGNVQSAPAVFTITLNKSLGSALSIPWTTANGTAGASDFTAASGTASIAAGATSTQVTVNVTGDK